MIPTEYYDRLWIETIVFIQKYWWLRSPFTNNDFVAYYVRPDGGFDSILNINVDGSYGI